MHPLQQNKEHAEKQADIDRMLADKDGSYRDIDLFKLVTRETTNQDVGAIVTEKDLKLMLLRHWSLQESIYHSNYVIAQLSLANDPGQNKYRELMARIGVPLTEAKQKYQYMDKEIRKSLKSKILEKSSAFGLDKILTCTHVRQVTDLLQVSSNDVAFAIASLLEAPQRGGATGTDDSVDKQLETLNQCLHDNFWDAYDALEPKNAGSHLIRGIGMAKDVQMAIVRVGISLIERSQVKVAQYFRYVHLENDYLKDIQLFQFPLALQKLGLFVMELYRSRRR